MKVIKHPPHTPATNSASKRRLALKALGGSALAGGLADKLPAAWQQPLVQSAVLPGHAQTSPAEHVIRMVLTRPNREGLLAFTFPYHITRDANTRITRVTFPNTVVRPDPAAPPPPPAVITTPPTATLPAPQAATTPSTESAGVLDTLFPAAHAQNAGDELRLMRDLTLEFPANRPLAQTGLLLFEYDGAECGFYITVNLATDRTLIYQITFPNHRVEHLDVNGDLLFAIRAGFGTNSGFGILNPGTGTPVTPFIPTAAPTGQPPAPAGQTTAAPQAPETGHIRLEVTDTSSPANVAATMTFPYTLERNATNQIEQLVFPATLPVQMVVHQPASPVISSLFPQALAQTGDLQLTAEVVLTFTDTDTGRTQTANLPLSYSDTACTGTFDVTVTLYPGLMDIYSVSGDNSAVDCGANVTVEADTDPGSGFGTFTPAPTPGPTTTAGPTTTTSPTTTLPLTQVAFASTELSVTEGETVGITFTVTGESAITFDMVLVSGAEVGNAELEAPVPPAGARFDNSDSNYAIRDITIAAGTGTRTASITLNAIKDFILEVDRVLMFQLEDARGASDGQEVAIGTNRLLTLTINDISLPTTDRLTLVEFEMTSITATEGENAQVTLIKTGGSSVTLDIVLLGSSTADASDIAGYTTPSALMIGQTGDQYSLRNIHIPAAETSYTFSIGILNDTQSPETGETLEFEIQDLRSPDPDQYIGLGDQTQLTIHILQADKPTIQFAEPPAGGYTVLEGEEIRLHFQIDNGSAAIDDGNVRFVVNATPMLSAPDDVDIMLAVTGTLRDEYESAGKIGVGFRWNRSGAGIIVGPTNDFVLDGNNTLTFSLLPDDKLDGKASDDADYDSVTDPNFYDNTRYHIGGRSAVTVTIVDFGTLPPTEAPTTTGGRTFNWSWSATNSTTSKTYTAVGSFVIPGTVTDTIIQEGVVTSHTYKVYDGDATSGTLLYSVDLSAGTITESGTDRTLTSAQDFEYNITTKTLNLAPTSGVNTDGFPVDFTLIGTSTSTGNSIFIGLFYSAGSTNMWILNDATGNNLVQSATAPTFS